MLQQNDRRSVTTGLRVNNETCEIFKPRDRVYWCSDRCCNECGIVETRVGTSNGDPSTDSYQIKRISDGVKIEVPGYILRRSAKYHPYHTRTRSSASTCSVHGPCHSKKVPQERKRRRHASGHPNPPDATIAKSLGNDGGFAKHHFSHKLLSPPENQEFGPLGIEIKPPSNPCAAPNCIMKRSNSGLPPVIQGWLSGPAGIVPPVGFPDADNEADAAPLSTSPSADEGVDLSDAMFSFDDDMILSPPLPPQGGAHLAGSHHNHCPVSSPAGGASFPLPPALSINATNVKAGAAAAQQQSSSTSNSTGGGTSDEDTPRTPVALPPPSMTYQPQPHMSNGCSAASGVTSRQQSAARGPGCSDSSAARAATPGSYFTRSQCSQQKSQTPGCSCVAFHFSSSSSCNGGEGGQLFLPPGGGGLLQVQVGSLANHSAGFSPASAAAHNTAAGCFNNATSHVVSVSESPSKLSKECILEHSTAVSDEGIVDYDGGPGCCSAATGAAAAMPRTPHSCYSDREVLGFLSPDSTCGGGGCAGDLSGEISDDDLDHDLQQRHGGMGCDVSRNECSLQQEQQTVSPPTNVPLMPPARVLRSRTIGCHSQLKSMGGGGNKSSSGYEGEEAFSEDELATASKAAAHKGLKPVRKFSEVLSCPVSRRPSGRSRSTRFSESSALSSHNYCGGSALSYNSLLSCTHTQQWVGALLTNNSNHQQHNSHHSTSSRSNTYNSSSSVDQVTTGLARMKTATPKMSPPLQSQPPCNVLENGAIYNYDVTTTDGDADLSDSQSAVGSDNQSTNSSSEGETPSAKKTRLQQRLLKQEQMMQPKTTTRSSTAAATSY